MNMTRAEQMSTNAVSAAFIEGSSLLPVSCVRQPDLRPGRATPLQNCEQRHYFHHFGKSRFVPPLLASPLKG
jgi:hypothetical protein